MQRLPKRFHLPTLIALFFGLSGAALATSVTIELSNGAAYAIELRSLDSSTGATSQPYLAFSGLGYVLRQFDPRCQWDWDARTGLLRVSVGQQRFSLSSAARADVVVNDKRVQVSSPIRFVESEIWIPLETVRVVVRSIEGLKLTEPTTLAANTAPTSAPIVNTPEQALGTSLLPEGSKPAAFAGSATMTAPVLPPPEVMAPWKAVFDPVLIKGTEEAEGEASALRPSLVLIGERCASVLNEEGSLQATLLSEHDEATSDDVILEWISRQPADVIIFLRFEVSPLRAQPGYTIFYADESVDWIGVEKPAGERPSAALVSRDQSYLPFQTGSRQLAERIGAGLATAPGFRDRLILPAPLYLLKRCSARSVMIVVSFPENSPELARLADNGFRELVARALAGALITFRRENPGPDGRPSSAETP